MDILYRVGVYYSGLLTIPQIEGLILDAMAQNMTHLLPREVLQHARQMAQRGALKLPASLTN